MQDDFIVRHFNAQHDAVEVVDAHGLFPGKPPRQGVQPEPRRERIGRELFKQLVRRYAKFLVRLCESAECTGKVWRLYERVHHPPPKGQWGAETKRLNAKSAKVNAPKLWAFTLSFHEKTENTRALRS